jgi:hypothetical protein
MGSTAGSFGEPFSAGPSQPGADARMEIIPAMPKITLARGPNRLDAVLKPVGVKIVDHRVGEQIPASFWPPRQSRISRYEPALAVSPWRPHLIGVEPFLRPDPSGRHQDSAIAM